jgi:FkbM family methyltransferase
MNIISLLKFISSHPLNEKNKTKSIIRFLKWQLNTKLNPFPIVYPYTEKAKLIIQKGMTGATGNLYCGLHEYHDMAFLLHLLRAEDLFIDIGANIGSYTVLASAHVGAETFSFEPVPSTFSHLINNISINQIMDKVRPFNIGLGSQKSMIKFTSTLDTMNHVASQDEVGTINVSIELLDDILQDTKSPILLKIDVEGFETEVIKGASKTLAKSGLKAIIIELNGSGARYGYDEREIHNTLINFDFKPFIYNPKARKLTEVEKFGTHNTIYIRDLDFVKQRLMTAAKIKILNNEL